MNQFNKGFLMNMRKRRSDEIKRIPPYVEETEESYDWLDAKVDGVSVEGIPLDGHYIDHLINYL